MRILLKNAWLLDADTYFRKDNVLIDGDMIRTSGISDSTDMTLDLAGYTLMPAVIDSHVHVSSRRGPSEKMLEGLASNGVLTVRDMGLLNNGSLEEYMAWLEDHKDPRYSTVVTAGRYVDVPEGYGMGPDGMEWGIKVTDPEEVRQAVSYQAGQGVYGIKTGLSDGYTGPVRKRIGEALLREIACAAADNGIRSSAHIGRCEDLDLIVSCGIMDSAHTPGDGEISDKCIGEMVNKGISMITTVGNMDEPCRFLPKGYESNDQYRDHQEQMLKNLKKYYDAGGMIGIGTDRQDRDGSGGNTMIPVWEMKQLKGAGVPFAEVIRAATENGAKICGIDDLGSIREGMRADLIAFPGRLSEDFNELKELSVVIHNGNIIIKKL